MLQNLFYIPEKIGGLPVFGFGILLAVWAIATVAIFAWLVWRQGWTKDTWSYVPILAVTGALIAFVLPNLVTPGYGLPIRGYGVMMLTAIVAAVALAMHRAKQMGVDPELILSLATWFFVIGIIGARAFYIIEYWDHFYKPGDLRGTLVAMINTTQGGLVVYGALLAGGAAFLVFNHKHRLPGMAFGDLIAPSVLLGMSLGRIGCFFTGCCYGGACDLPWAVQFPEGSPPHMKQVSQGELYGLKIDQDAKGKCTIAAVAKDSPAERAGLKAGDEILGIPQSLWNDDDKGRALTVEEQIGSAYERMMRRDERGQSLPIDTQRGRFVIRADRADLAQMTRIHPTQLYSAIDAGLLCLFLWFYYPFRRRDGELVALTLLIHPISRFLLEIIRTDEASVFGTGLSISQNISVLIFLGGVCIGVYVLMQKEGTVWGAARREGIGNRE